MLLMKMDSVQLVTIYQHFQKLLLMDPQEYMIDQVLTTMLDLDQFLEAAASTEVQELVQDSVQAVEFQAVASELEVAAAASIQQELAAEVEALLGDPVSDLTQASEADHLVHYQE
jgi:hypothetical protein